MRVHRPEVADVFRNHGASYLEAWGNITSPIQRRTLKAISVCRTGALGGHKRRCDQCGHEEISYNSCRDRHCPKCQGSATARWLEDRERDLLPTPYFHVVFTLPEALASVALQNKRLIYGLLFRTVSETLLTIARDPRHLGAEIGFLAVLHTWGQNLHHHPHIHCLVPGGGLAPDGSRWIPSHHGFLLPVRVLSRLLRRRFLQGLALLRDRGRLTLEGNLTSLRDRQRWHDLIRDLTTSDWVVYAKPPFGSPSQVLKYLARYTHRVAISNRRLISLTDGKVSFQWTDYAHGNRTRVMTLKAVEFIRRFLLHVLPPGFMHIRYYGFLANRMKQSKLALARRLITQTPASHNPAPGPSAPVPDEPEHKEQPGLCPACKKGRLILVGTFDPETQNPFPPARFDTS
jgi:hypothetical protein